MKKTNLFKFNIKSVLTIRFAHFQIILILSFLLISCSTTIKKTYVGSPGPYDSYYKNKDKKGLNSNFVAPEAVAIKKVGQTWEYMKPFNEVWQATLDVLSQYQGILDMKMSSNQRSLLVLKARSLKLAPENRDRTATYGSFFEQWLGVAIIEGQYGSEVAVASIEPSTGSLRNNEGAAQLLFSQIQIQLYSVPSWNDKFVYERLPQYNRTNKAKLIHDDKNMFYKHQELEQLLGNWVSKSLQEELITVYSPEVTTWLDSIVYRLKMSAGVTDMQTSVSVVPSNRLNAFALPNGDIFVSSGLLDSLDNESEVAAVLAHELDHLICHDIVERLHKQQTGQRGAWFTRTSMAIADTALGMFLGVSNIGPVTDGVVDLVHKGTSDIAERGARHMETAWASNFSEDTELRADENGIKNLYAAGYNPETNIAMLNILHTLQDKALEKDEFVMSNLINKTPGIDERIKNLKKILIKITK